VFARVRRSLAFREIGRAYCNAHFTSLAYRLTTFTRETTVFFTDTRNDPDYGPILRALNTTRPSKPRDARGLLLNQDFLRDIRTKQRDVAMEKLSSFLVIISNYLPCLLVISQNFASIQEKDSRSKRIISSMRIRSL